MSVTAFTYRTRNLRIQPLGEIKIVFFAKVGCKSLSFRITNNFGFILSVNGIFIGLVMSTLEEEMNRIVVSIH